MDGASIVPFRDSGGRFLPGNRLGRGNPHSKQVARLRSALLAAVDENDIDAVIRVLVRKARGGDVAAARVLFDRLFGKPKIAETESAEGSLDACETMWLIQRALFGPPGAD